MTTPRLNNPNEIIEKGKCCHAKKMISINQRRRNTLRSEKLDEDYWDAFYLREYVKVIETKAFRDRLSEEELINIMDRIVEMCDC